MVLPTLGVSGEVHAAGASLLLGNGAIVLGDMEPPVVRRAEPSHLQRLRIIIVMSLDADELAADFASPSKKRPCSDGRCDLGVSSLANLRATFGAGETEIIDVPQSAIQRGAAVQTVVRRLDHGPTVTIMETVWQ